MRRVESWLGYSDQSRHAFYQDDQGNQWCRGSTAFERQERLHWDIDVGDVADLLKNVESNSFDALLCDPPSGIEFRGLEWDSHKGGRDAWCGWLTGIAKELWRVLKPGAYGVVWSLPKTSHWTGWALDSAGFEVVDTIHHIVGKGMPKSRNGHVVERDDQLPTDSLVGAGTALAPTHECWWLIQKPRQGTVGRNVEQYGTGMLNIDGARIKSDLSRMVSGTGKPRSGKGSIKGYGDQSGATFGGDAANPPNDLGLWPKNQIFSHSPECKVIGERIVKGRAINRFTEGAKPFGGGVGKSYDSIQMPDQVIPIYECCDDCCVPTLQAFKQDAPNFYYCPKPSKRERNFGLEGWGRSSTYGHEEEGDENTHPTIKSIDLTWYLATLIKPPQHYNPAPRMINPFTGSGGEMIGSVLAGYGYVYGIELDKSFAKTAAARTAAWWMTPQPFQGVKKVLG